MANSRYPELNLDLTFRPLMNPSPVTFSQRDLAQYDALGYITGVPLLAPDVARGLARDFAAGPDPSALNPHVHDDWVAELVRTPQLLDCLRDLLGPDIVCFMSQFIDKAPGSARQVAGHQDCAFNAMDARSVIVWLALDDAQTENGCMWFVPGSHRHGALEVEDPATDLNAAAADRDQLIDQLGKVPIELLPGQAVFFSDLVLHLSPPNTSRTRSRPAFTMSFCSAATRPHPDPRAKHQPLICCGSDDEGNWG